MQYFLQLTKILKKKSVHHKTLTRPDLFISFSACVLFFMYSIHVYITVNILWYSVQYRADVRHILCEIS